MSHSGPCPPLPVSRAAVPRLPCPQGDPKGKGRGQKETEAGLLHLWTLSLRLGQGLVAASFYCQRLDVSSSLYGSLYSPLNLFQTFENNLSINFSEKFL